MKKQWENFWKYRYLLAELVKKGVRLKYRRSYLGVIWSLLEPLMMTIVLTIVFGTLFKNRSHNFPAYILAGRLFISFFTSTTKSCLKSIRSNSGMIKKVYVPKYLYPLSGVLYNYIIFLMSMIIMIVLSLYLGIYPTVHTFGVIVPLLLLPLLSYGCGMILATIGVFFRDMEYLWNIITTIIMYASAIFYYPQGMLESQWWWILRYNPMFCLIANFRGAVFGYPMDVGMNLYAAGFTAVTLIVGTYVFKKKQDEFILHI